MKNFHTVLLTIEVLHAIAGVIVVTKILFAFILVKSRFCIPHGPLQDIDYNSVSAK
jgi:hypothetical protein